MEMRETIRDSVIGQAVRLISGGRYFKYAEEKEGFVLPEKYRRSETDEKRSRSQRNSGRRRIEEGEERRSGGPAASEDTVVDDDDKQNDRGGGGEAEEEDDESIVTWYSDDDPENPQNWSIVKKCWVVLAIMLMTSSVYMGSSIWSPATVDGAMYFGVGEVTATLGLSLFVLGYGVGPLFLAPITEIPAVGRTIPYIVTLALFCVLQVPTALVTNFAGFAILRFLAGFVGSPPLATGGASISDMFAPHKMPYALGLWGLSAGASPALAPIVAGFAVEAKGWRWSFWEMLWLSGFTLALLIFLLPETSSKNILLRRAKRLRKLTGNDKLKSQAEIEQAQMTSYQIVQMSLLRPLSMTFTEPIVTAIDLYIGLIYAILYSYFESYPIVYGPMGYGWKLGVSNLPFASLLVGAIFSYGVYCLWNKYYFEPKYLKEKEGLRPEARLPMSMAAAIVFPISLFWFAWTANRTHWIAPVISGAFFGMGLTWMFMPFLSYLPHAYPEYAASVLASNDFLRSTMGAGMPLAAHGLFVNLGIDWGNTLLALLTVLFIPIPFVLYKAGPWLRSKSPRALHDDDLKKAKEEADASNNA